jgi:hypothetical protein
MNPGFPLCWCVLCCCQERMSSSPPAVDQVCALLQFSVVVLAATGVSEGAARVQRVCSALVAHAREALALALALALPSPAPAPDTAFFQGVTTGVCGLLDTLAAVRQPSAGTVDDWGHYVSAFVPLSLEDWWLPWLVGSCTAPGPVEPRAVGPWRVLAACAGFLQRFVAGGLEAAGDVARYSTVALNAFRMARGILMARCAGAMDAAAAAAAVGDQQSHFTPDNWVWRCVGSSLRVCVLVRVCAGCVCVGQPWVACEWVLPPSSPVASRPSSPPPSCRVEGMVWVRVRV